ncbi:bifunctional alpha,alpha-trehalose-phosphate synthase (UDP-forming)/trehalose-phosphatase [Alkalibaculum sp. M08DMB]|uniref:Bifunctional alpha,alpha-trehalose-phosphate synthase (UDP-forming)/trehalose-phosphatase n=1 Tax=Alkalibaculum sporogenes TaxID=2655001 RepID=A0A6A7K4Y5_9FIRM|nr:bifunctional alpha,alpha-trehalose-phosphate synthase (UDP-forming)/trehalose-phosphatase [Alkalibaculum sporogenes]
MSKIIFVSNRLPVTVSKNQDEITYNKSIGGLATGLKSYHEKSDSLWVGWPGISNEEINVTETQNIENKLMNDYKCLPVLLSNKDIEEYYFGFCNNTIWPLFHYFTNKTEYEFSTWETYQKVNKIFFDAVDSIIEEDDTIWIHDYQLMLLPKMIKEKYPNTKIGFFLHIPFPSYEIFRLLVWREEIILGILGADLIGFHTYEYVRHFLSCTRRLIGLEHNLNQITYEDRYVQVDAFPMGIDYDFFSKDYDDNQFQIEAKEIVDNIKGTAMILSIDRLDYTKGIPERIKAFSYFLQKYPEYIGKVRLNLIVAPSRVEVESYELLRREITELVSEINGKFGTFSWMPIWFFFQSFTQESLIAFYRHSQVLLVTPLRDGMNLVAKEYIASRNDYDGMVVISETAGAASELGEAVIVNVNDYDAISLGIKTALEMPHEEKISRNKIMHTRLKRYNVEFWASEFLNTLERTAEESRLVIAQRSIERDSNIIEQDYKSAQKRVLFLDYDGTLVGFKPRPEQAKPDLELRELLTDLTKDPKNTVVIISGRDRHTLDDWLGDLNLHFIASHGLWLRPPNEDWTMSISLTNDWKDSVRHLLEMYTDRMPGSLIEEKEFSIAWHYRQCEPDMAAVKLSEVREALMYMTASMNLGLQEGNKVLEIKDNRVNKGFASSSYIHSEEFDFILGVGDDFTDEDLFLSLPEDAFTIKIGLGNTNAKYHLKSWKSMRALLKKLINTNEKQLSNYR